jgi:hypothetical protein
VRRILFPPSPLRGRGKSSEAATERGKRTKLRPSLSKPLSSKVREA